MTSLPEQFYAARQTQIDKQFQFLRVLGDQALDRTSRVLALNLDASRSAVEHSSSTMRQLMALRDPRDLFNIGAQAQRQLRTMIDYSRELFSIATGLRGFAIQTYSVETPALAAPAPVEAAPLKEAEIIEDATAAVAASVEEVLSETKSVAEPVSAAEPAPAVAAAPVPAADTVLADAAPAAGASTAAATEASAPLAVATADNDAETTSAPVSDLAPPVAPTPIARAASEVLDMPLAPSQPVAASVPVEVAVEIEVPKIAPLEAAPPVAAPANGTPKVTEIRSGRGRKKQS